LFRHSEFARLTTPHLTRHTWSFKVRKIFFDSLEINPENTLHFSIDVLAENERVRQFGDKQLTAGDNSHDNME
jgi:hypothetical protein